MNQKTTQLSRRERQIMEIIHQHHRAAVNDIQAELPDPPTHTAVRTLLKILEAKGHVKREKKGREFIYMAKADRKKEGQSAMQNVIHTFFGGSFEQALSAHLADRNSELTQDQLKRVAVMISDARREGR